MEPSSSSEEGSSLASDSPSSSYSEIISEHTLELSYQTLLRSNNLQGVRAKIIRGDPLPFDDEPLLACVQSLGLEGQIFKFEDAQRTVVVDKSELLLSSTRLAFATKISIKEMRGIHIPRLSNILFLAELAITDCGLRELEPSLLSLNLERLDLSGNPFADLPDELGELQFLQSLSLRRCNLPIFRDRWLSPRLAELDIRENALLSLPVAVTRVQTVLFEGNPELGLPLTDWRPFVERKARETIYQNRFRVLMVGGEGVGKTCLLRSILANGPVPVKPSVATDGIEMHNLELPAPRLARPKAKLVSERNSLSTSHSSMESSESLSSISGSSGGASHARSKPNPNPLCLTFLDFGGQDIYFPTHEFFVPKSAVFLVMFSLPAALHQSASPSEMSLNYWLEKIKTLIGNSNSPVFLVGTQYDALTKEEMASLDDKLRGRFPIESYGLNIVESRLFLTSGKTSAGVGELRMALDQVVRNPSFFPKIPAYHEQYAAILEGVQADSVGASFGLPMFLTEDRFGRVPLRIAERLGSDRDRTRNAIQFLVNTGRVG